MAKQKKLSVPRALEEIQKEYQTICFNAGQVQYQLSVYNQELDTLNKRLFNINNEAAARNKLEADKKELTAAGVPTNG